MLRLRTITTFAGVFGLAIAALVPLTQTAQAQSVIKINNNGTHPITVEKGKPKTVRTDRPYSEIVVGDPEIATVQPLTDRSFYVLGLSSGTTGIAFFDENQQVAGVIDLEVSLDTTRLKSSIRQNVPDADINVNTSNGRIVISGDAPDQVSADMAKRIAEGFAGEDDDIISSVKVTSSQQVQLNVRFVEVNRTAGQDLGVRWGQQNGSILNPTYNDANDNEGESAIGVLFPAGPNAYNMIGRFIDGSFSIDVAIKAMEDKGLARRLAEPNLVTRSGETAEFLAGGEFPIPFTNKDGSIDVEYKKFGVGLEFTPTVLKDGLISLDIAPEVSTIDTSERSQNYQFPVFLVRRAKTSVDLRSGQSFMIAGLFQAENESVTDRIPGVGRAPVIGSLFSSKAFKRKETDLVMIVTPHLVRPVGPNTPLITPMDGSRPATTPENVVSQIDEVKTSALAAKSSVEPAKRTFGHILSLDLSEGEQ